MLTQGCSSTTAKPCLCRALRRDPSHRQPLTSTPVKPGNQSKWEAAGRAQIKQQIALSAWFCSPERKREVHSEATSKNTAPFLHPLLADAAPRSWKGEMLIDILTCRKKKKGNIAISGGLLLVPASSTDFCIASASSWSAMSSGRTSSRPAPYASRAHSGSSPSGRKEVCEPVVPITSTFFLRSMEHCKRALTHQGPAESQAAPRGKGRHKVRQSISNGNGSQQFGIHHLVGKL